LPQELSKQYNKRKFEIEAKAKAEKTKADDARQKQAAADDKVALDRINHAKQTRSFSANWASAGHPAIAVYDDIAAMSSTMKENKDPYASPYILKSVNSVLPIEGRLENSLDAWAKSYPSFCLQKNVKKSQAELTVQMGSDSLNGLVENVLPSRLQFTGGLPSTQAQLSNAWLYGYMDTLVTHDFESNFLGCLRYQHAGHMAYLLVSASDLVQGLPKLLPELKASPPSSHAVKDWVESLNTEATDLSEEAMKKILAAGIKIQHATIDPGQLLVIPPGTFVAAAVVKQASVHGVRKYFLPTGASVQTEFASLAKSFSDNASALNFLKTTLDSMSLV
jgi:hypothetical protein